MKNCRHLESLRITADDRDRKVQESLQENIKFAEKLTEFSFKTAGDVYFDSFIDSFNHMPAKLKRIYFQCNFLNGNASNVDESVISEDALQRFYDRNPQVVLFVVEHCRKSFYTRNTFRKHSDCTDKCVRSIYDKVQLPKHIRNVHNDFIYGESYAGIDPFVDF